MAKPRGVIMLMIMPLRMAPYQPQIAELCRKHRIARLELFGSAARGDFDPQTGDLDFFVTLEHLGWKGSFDRYISFKFDLEELFGGMSQNFRASESGS